MVFQLISSKDKELGKGTNNKGTVINRWENLSLSMFGVRDVGENHQTGHTETAQWVKYLPH